MADKPKKPQKLKARLPRGLADRTAADIAATRAMLAKIQEVYELYGFEPVETPAIEYTDALGKFLPDQDRPNEGVFSFQDDDEQWLSLRYDLTAPLARYVAENFDSLPKPYRSYRAGYVYRNEKPGPGRFRQFMQFDADTVGSASPAADAEMCMMAADAMEALGFARGQYVVKVNNRKVLDGVMEASGLGGNENSERRLIVLRAFDKFDRLGWDGVIALLKAGRLDESGDFTPGADLDTTQLVGVLEGFKKGNTAHSFRNITQALEKSSASLKDLVASPETRGLIEKYFFMVGLSDEALLAQTRPIRDDDFFYEWNIGKDKVRFQVDNLRIINSMKEHPVPSAIWQDGVKELESIARIVDGCGYGSGRILIDPSVVRGLEYYTGPVFEVELLIETNDDKGRPVRFGSVGGGGRYDGLVSRFRGEPVPATGFSIGVSRLAAALDLIRKDTTPPSFGPVVVTVFDRERLADYQQMVARLRDAGIRAELYLGNPKNMGNQLKYADRRNSPCVIIQGSDEKARGEVQIKDLIEGAKAAAAIASNQEWRESRPAQFSCAESDLVARVREVLARHDVEWR